MADGYDPELCQPVFDSFRRNGTANVPTHVTRRFDAMVEDSAYRNDPRARYIPADQWKAWNDDADGTIAADPSPAGRASRVDFYRTGLRATGDAFRAGVRVILGTDSGDSYIFPGFALHDELEELVKAGLTPAEALHAATLAGAEFLGRSDDFGTVEVGRVADLVLLEADPLAEITNTRRIRDVIIGGRHLDRAALDAMLDEVERAAHRVEAN